jgi:hypothetical protein
MKTSTIIGICGILALAGTPAAMAASTPIVVPQGTGMALATVYHEVTGELLSSIPVQVRPLYPKADAKPLTFWTNKLGQTYLGPLEDGWYVAYIHYQNTQSSGTSIFRIDGRIDVIPQVELYIDLPMGPDA